MRLSSDEWVLWQNGVVKINMTIATTWALMLILTAVAKLVTRKLTVAARVSRWQCALETVVGAINQQVNEIGVPHPQRYLPFIGTLFLFIATANLATIVPGYDPPTGSLSTTAALAICVFVAVPIAGFRERGWRGYLRSYVRPTVLMLPFNIIGEVSRTLALAVRLFGNMMSGAMILAILLSVTPFFFPIVMNLLGLLTGMVQAYIFSILAAVYIAAATRSSRE
jgi:F-type H+-transporting ATPase subunit a